MQKPHPAYGGNAPFIFVSYAHADEGIVYPELRWLQDQGINLWYDEGISGASRWRDAIAGQIARCRLFVLYVSPNSADSQVCREELEYALDRGCSILSIHIEPTELPEGMRLAISNRQGLLRYELEPADYQRKISSTITSSLNREEIVSDEPMPVVQPDPAKRSTSVRTLAAGIIAGIAIGMLVAVMAGQLFSGPQTANQSFRFDLALTDPPLHFGVNEIGATLTSMTLTVDGGSLIYVGRDENGQYLYRRNLKTGETRRIENTRDAVLPLVSPDSDWLAFFVGNELFQMPVGGGPRSRIGITGNVDNANWGAPDSIAVIHDDGNTVSFVSPKRATQFKRFEDWRYGTPLLLSDGERLLTSAGGEIVLISSDTAEPRPVGISGHSPIVRNGYILALTAVGLTAARFDEASGMVTSVVVTIPMSIRRDWNAQWALAANGLFAYAPGGLQQMQPLAWGRPPDTLTALPYEARLFGTVSISPDGQSFAAAETSLTERMPVISVYSLAEKFARKIPLSAPGYVLDITWRPDASGFYFSLLEGRDTSTTYFHQLNTDVIEKIELDIGDNLAVNSVDRSGNLLTIETGGVLWVHDVERGMSTSLVEDATAWGSEISPGGEGVAFVSRRSGSYEIFYKLNDDSKSVVQVSRSPGSEEPRWNEDGSRLYYRDGTKIMFVDVLDGRTGRFGPPQVFFEGNFANVAGRSFDIARDESAALVKMLPPATAEVVQIETNWFDKLESLLSDAERSTD
jgi:hypothetical protein